MLKNFLYIIIFFILSENLLAQTAVQPAGDGSPGNPWQIATLENLYWMSQTPGISNNHFIQTDDIDASATNTWEGGQGFLPLNLSYGSYNGGGHTISNLYINRDRNSVGLFGSASFAVIANLGLINVFSAGNVGVGGLVGYLDGTSYIENCYSTGNVFGSMRVGGLIGTSEHYQGNTPRIANSHSSASVSCGGDGSGGFIGYSIISIISKCYSTGSVSGATFAGGFLGYGSYATINNCYSTGNVNGGNNTGGFLGYNSHSPITSCFSTGSVSSTGQRVGGLIGSISTAGISIINCYSTGSVTGSSQVGGLIGFNDPMAEVINSFWDIEISGRAASAGGTGKTTAEMKSKSTYTNAVWNFINTWFIIPDLNNGYPVLRGVTPGARGASTHSAANISFTSATLNGAINPAGTSAAVRFLFGTTPGVYTDSVLATQSPVSSSVSTPISVNLNGLTRGITYYYLVSGTTASPGDYFTGTEMSFTTLNPAAGVSAAANIIAESALISGTVNPQGVSTTVRLLFGTSPGVYTDSVPASPAAVDGYAATPVSVNLEGLTAGKKYYYRISGTSASPSYYFVSDEKSFTTNSPYAKWGTALGYAPMEYCNNGSVNIPFSVPVTLECWVKWNGTTGKPQAIAAGNNLGFGSGLYLLSDKLNSITATESFSAGSPFPVGSWVHIAAQYGADFTISMFINGVSQSLTFKGDNAPAVQMANLTYGGNSANEYFNGWIDEVRLSNVIRYTTDFTPPTAPFTTDANTLALYHFDESTGTTTADESGHGYHLTLVNNPSWEDLNEGLPVELTSFTAGIEEDKVVLKWETATEVNNYGYQVQRKKEKVQSEEEKVESEWESIGFVEGSGNSNSPKEYSFVDNNPLAGNLQYRLKQIDTDGAFEYYGPIAEVYFNVTGINEKNIPTEFRLEQNYPNPFNPVTVISYQLSVISHVTLKIYDVLGNEVATLINEEKAPGYYSVNFDAGNLSSGMYIYKLTAAGRAEIFSSTKKLMLLK